MLSDVSAILFVSNQTAAQDLSVPRKLDLSYGQISSVVSSLSCASAASFNSTSRRPPRSRNRFPLPSIIVSSSSSSFFFLEPSSESSHNDHLSLLAALPGSSNGDTDGEVNPDDDSCDVDQDLVCFDAVPAYRSSVITPPVDYSQSGMLWTSYSPEEAVDSTESPNAVEMKTRHQSLRVSSEKSRRGSRGYLSKGSYKIMSELETLAYIVKALETPKSSTMTPPNVHTGDSLAENASALETEEVRRPVSGLGIRFFGDDEDKKETSEEKRHTYLRTTRSFSEPSSSLRRRFHHAFDSLQKSFRKREEIFSPKTPLPVNRMSELLVSEQVGTALAGSHRKSHISLSKRNRAISSSPTGSNLFAMSGDFFRRSLDIVTPHPRLTSLHSGLPVSSRDVFSLSPASAISGTVKFSSLRDLVRRR